VSGLDPRGWRRLRWLNRLQTFALMSVLFGLQAMIGWLLWGVDGVIVLVGGTMLAMVIAPRVSPRWIMRLHGALPLPVERVPTLYTALVELSRRAELPEVPALYYMPSRLINAFAVGDRRQAGIAVTDGLLRQLDVREAIGVLAHEISHVRANDLRVMALADLLSRMTGVMAWLGLLLLLFTLPLWWLAELRVNWLIFPLLLAAPLLSLLAQLGLSRLREYNADMLAARLTGDPEGLARALWKIEQRQGGWMERLLMPSRLPMPDWLRTHPPTAERVRRLMALRRDEPGLMYLYPHSLAPRGIPVVSLRPRRRINGLWY